MADSPNFGILSQLPSPTTSVQQMPNALAQSQSIGSGLLDTVIKGQQLSMEQTRLKADLQNQQFQQGMAQQDLKLKQAQMQIEQQSSVLTNQIQQQAIAAGAIDAQQKQLAVTQHTNDLNAYQTTLAKTKDPMAAQGAMIQSIGSHDVGQAQSLQASAQTFQQQALNNNFTNLGHAAAMMNQVHSSPDPIAAYKQVGPILKSQLDPNAPDPATATKQQIESYGMVTLGSAIPYARQIGFQMDLQKTALQEKAKANEAVATQVLNKAESDATEAAGSQANINVIKNVIDKASVGPAFNITLNEKKALSAVTGKDVSGLAPMEALNAAVSAQTVNTISGLKGIRPNPTVIATVQNSLAQPTNSVAGMKAVLSATELQNNLKTARATFMGEYHDNHPSMTGADTAWQDFTGNLKIINEKTGELQPDAVKQLDMKKFTSSEYQPAAPATNAAAPATSANAALENNPILMIKAAREASRSKK